MQALIMDRGQVGNALLRLNNGETVFGRQLRLLRDCGIEDFIVALGEQEAAIKEICGKVSGANFTFVKQDVAENGVFLPCWMEQYAQTDTVVLTNNLIFSKAFIDDFIHKEQPFMMAVGPMQMTANDRIKVKLDMNKAQYISNDISGYGCFDMIPVYKMSPEAIVNCLQAQQQADSAGAAFEMAAKALPLHAFYSEKYWVEDVSSAVDEQSIIEKADQFYRTELQIFNQEHAILQLEKILKENRVQKLLIVCDGGYDSLPIKHLLPAGLETKICSVEEIDMNKSQETAASAKEEGYDTILSVGGTKATDYAKAVKLWIHWDGKSNLSDLPTSGLRHIAVVTRIELFNVFSSAVAVNGCTVEHEMLRPNTIICDYNVYTQDPDTLRRQNALDVFCYNLDILLGYRANPYVASTVKRNLMRLCKNILPYIENPSNRNAAGMVLQVCLQTASILDLKEERILPIIARPLAETCGLPITQACLYCAPSILSTLAKHLSAEKINEILQVFGVRRVNQANAVLYALCMKLCASPVLDCNGDALKLAQRVETSKIRGIDILITAADINGVYTSVWKNVQMWQQRMQSVVEMNVTPAETENAAEEGENLPMTFAKQLEDANSWRKLLALANAPNGRNRKKGLIKKIKHILYTRFSRQSLVRKIANALLFAKRRLGYLNLRRKYPVNKKMIVFDSFNGKKYNCNPKGIYEELIKDPAYCDFIFVWAFKNPEKYNFLKQHPNTRVVKMDSLRYRMFCAQAGYWIANAGMPAYLVPKKNQQYIHTWHGKPFKAIGCDVGFKTAGGRGAKENRKIYTALSRKLTVLFSPSPIFTPKMTSAFNLKRLGKADIVYESGYPRNDYLFNYDPQDVIKVKLSLGVPLDKKVVLYAPTWRPTVYQAGVGYVYHNPMDFDRLHEALGDDYVVIFRAHINEANSVDFTRYGDFLIDATGVEDVNHLYIISDLMISDYSGTIFDYANLKRPMVLYMYDKDSYVNDLTGTYFAPEELPGEIVLTQDEMHESIIRQLAHFTYDEKYRKFNESFNALDGPDCAKRIIGDLIDPAPKQTKAEQRREKIKGWTASTKVKLNGLRRITGLAKDANTLALKSYKDKHLGERCFLVGNGPSLRMADLEKIQNEVTFSCNLIHKIFDKTSWRPTYHCITDNIFTKTIADELLEKNEAQLFMGHVAAAALKGNRKTREKAAKKVISVQSIAKDPYYVKGDLFNYFISSKATVMSFMVELAMYMGFKEIYLIGVDCSNGFTGQNTHFIEDYENEDMMRIEHKRAKNIMHGKHMTLEELGKYRTDRAMFAYAKLRQYADKHGIKIYNATRGGYLEEFERVNLDDLEFKTE